MSLMSCDSRPPLSLQVLAASHKHAQFIQRPGRRSVSGRTNLDLTWGALLASEELEVRTQAQAGIHPHLLLKAKCLLGGSGHTQGSDERTRPGLPSLGAHLASLQQGGGGRGRRARGHQDRQGPAPGEKRERWWGLKGALSPRALGRSGQDLRCPNLRPALLRPLGTPSLWEQMSAADKALAGGTAPPPLNRAEMGASSWREGVARTEPRLLPSCEDPLR